MSKEEFEARLQRIGAERRGGAPGADAWSPQSRAARPARAAGGGEERISLGRAFLYGVLLSAAQVALGKWAGTYGFDASAGVSVRIAQAQSMVAQGGGALISMMGFGLSGLAQFGIPIAGLLGGRWRFGQLAMYVVGLVVAGLVLGVALGLEKAVSDEAVQAETASQPAAAGN